MKGIKKAKRGRPAGSDKKALNIYLKKDHIERLKSTADSEKRTISAVVETALEQAGI